MAHKTLIGGTAYEIDGGKTLVNGTAYSIKSGKTLVGGTSYKIGFNPIVKITHKGTHPHLGVTINNTEYKTENCEIEVTEGTIIQCKFFGTSLSSENRKTTGQVIINGETVAKATGAWDTYDYVVKGDVSIHLELRDVYTGIITITEH